MALLRALTGTLTWPLRHIRTKIIVHYAVLTVVLAMGGAYLVTQLVAGSLQERFDNQLAVGGAQPLDPFLGNKSCSRFAGTKRSLLQSDEPVRQLACCRPRLQPELLVFGVACAEQIVVLDAILPGLNPLHGARSELAQLAGAC